MPSNTHETDVATRPKMVANKRRLRFAKKGELRQSMACAALGSGSFGIVTAADFIPENVDDVKIPVVIKVLNLDPNSKAGERIIAGARMAATFKHPNVLRLLAVSKPDNYKCLELVTRLMPIGNLLNFVRKHRRDISSKQIMFAIKQIADGMKYLEARGFVHGNLAARNVLVENLNNVKITDFGLAKHLEPGESTFTKEEESGEYPIIRWQAPECFRKQMFTTKSDVWAFGVTVWELLMLGQTPYPGLKLNEIPELLMNRGRLEQPPTSSYELWSVIRKCFKYVPDNRPDFKFLVGALTNFANDDPEDYIRVEYI